MPYSILYLLLFLLNFNFILCDGKDHILPSDDAFKLKRNACGESGYILVATVDGNLTALDFDSGDKCWSVVLDAEGFISSSLSKLEVLENGSHVWLIPSLDGVLFKYDKIKLVPLPFNAESLLSQSTILDQSTSIVGGKFKLVYGICRHTGEIYYKCSVDGCKIFKEVSTGEALVIEQTIQSVNAVDSISAKQRWHFRVVDTKIKVIVDSLTNKSASYQPNTFEENALIPLNDYSDFNNLNALKISLQNGYMAKLNHSSFDVTWLYQTSSPIVDVWYIKDGIVQLLDPFADASEHFSFDSDDGKQSALLFLGSYMDQLFVKQSRMFKNKVVHNHALSTQFPYQAYCVPVNLMPKVPFLLPANESNAVLPANININDYGFYFYVNVSVYDNDTHCIVDFLYPKQSTKLVHTNYWLGRFAAVLIAILTIVGCIVIRRFHIKKQFANEGTSTLELSSVVKEVPIGDKEVKQDFISRFHKDFQLITILGKGGFGVVMEVKNKIDDCEYAVKRIRISVGEKYKKLGYGSVMREVKALAKLDHPGIVRYFNSWVENPPKGWQELKDRELDIIDVSHSTNCEDDDPMDSSSAGQLRKKKNETHVKIIEKLRVNPLNPFLDSDFADHVFNDNPDGLSGWSSENSHTHKDSDTLSLKSTSKKSISEMSLCYDPEDESSSSEDSITNRQMFFPKRHAVNKSYKDSRSNDSVSLFKYSSAGSKVSDIRTMFSIPNELFIDKEAVFLHLKKVNNYLAWRMNQSYLDKLYRYIFYDILYFDPDHSDCHQWMCILDSVEPNKVVFILSQLQTWLLSVLCALRYAESYYHNLLYSNLCNILWEVNLILKVDVCNSFPSKIPPKKTSTTVINAFFNLKKMNDDLIWPMKFIYLLKLRHYLFCESDQCVLSDWKSFFYQGDINIYQKNLKLFQIWLISTLCKVACKEDLYNDCIVSGLCNILYEVNSILLQKSIILNSSEKFFYIYGNLLTQPKDVIQLEENKYIQFLIMFHNSELPGKCKLQAVEEKDQSGFLYIQMQLCRRESLRNWLDTHSMSRSYSEVMKMFFQIVDAMDYVHTRGLMHRDLKPSNIYFSLEGYIKIGDFGLATQFEVQGSDDSSSTSSVNYHTRDCGTELYMSPEQRSKKNYNFKTDIFALGIILYELLVPFETRSERYKAIYAARDRTFSPDFISTHPNECMLVRKLLDQEPKQRPTASEIKNHPLCQPFLQLSRT